MAESTITRLVGTPFVNGGRSIRKGLDCWGLVMTVFRRVGITIPDFTVDAFAFQAIDALAGKEVESRIWEEVYDPINSKTLLVVLMRMHPKHITHAGVYIGDGKIIHTMEKTGTVISKISTLKGAIAGYYRYVDNN